jgi:hypothetical protein
MALTFYNIKKWYKMLTGKSILHVNQDIGKHFSSEVVKGYYNNLTEKVIKEPELLKSEQIPTVITEKGEVITFPVAVFQYGLGAYDLYLDSNDEIYLKKFFDCVKWALTNQEPTGAWSNFSFIYPEHPYGAMCQGEGASLLIRAYVQTKEEKYLSAAKKAIDFMLLPVTEGGTTKYSDEECILLEYTHKAAVLNGWVFALFGLFDYLLVDDTEEYRTKYNLTLKSLINRLPNFDNGYWSLYDLDKKITSPFYHNLHIAQMQALYKMTNEKIFDNYAKKWEEYSNSYFKKTKAFVKKAFQKIIER